MTSPNGSCFPRSVGGGSHSHRSFSEPDRLQLRKDPVSMRGVKKKKSKISGFSIRSLGSAKVHSGFSIRSLWLSGGSLWFSASFPDLCFAAPGVLVRPATTPRFVCTDYVNAIVGADDVTETRVVTGFFSHHSKGGEVR